jgi:anaerobic magnesium-protoporphyrin IX monomethyl ester cyclase
MKITLINPNNVTQKWDFFGTGIPYLPIVLAYLAAFLRKEGNDIRVIDAFGENPFKKRHAGEFIIHGLTNDEIIREIDKGSELVCVYAGHMVEHKTILEIVRDIKKNLDCPVAIVENSQAVTAYSLLKVKDDFFRIGADFIILGDPELLMSELVDLLGDKAKVKEPFSIIKGLVYKDKDEIRVNEKRDPITNLDSLPFPAWDLFPVKNYWKLGYAHAPYRESYLPLLSSRGCPYHCMFCIVPYTNERRWRGRSAENVYDELKYFVDKYSVREFHFEDLNPILSEDRIEELCRMIIAGNMKVKLKFASGTKIDVINEDTIRLLKKAGCDYISFSPESGSEAVLKLMRKPFDHEKALNMLKIMKILGITTQACFVIGFPGEQKEDIKKTKKYLYKLFKAGLDEAVIPIMAPLPGAEVYESLGAEIDNLSMLTFSPKWRKDYKYLNRERMKMYLVSYMIKMIFHPLKFFGLLLNLVLGNYKSKSEMTIYRIFKTHFAYQQRP